MKKVRSIGCSFCRNWIFLVLIAFIASTGSGLMAEESVYGDDMASTPKPTWPPKGKPTKCKVSRDTFTATVGKENIACNGGVSRNKLKGQQEHILFDADLSALKGKIITGALWHFKVVNPNIPFRRVGISSVASEWVEGKNRSMYQTEKGASSFMQAKQGVKDWAFPGSSILNVTFGFGHTLWRFAEASPPKGGWQAAAVEPDVVAARLAGISHGFFVMDEVGNEWGFKDKKFVWKTLPNRFMFSKEQGNAAPWLEVWTNGTDSTPPEAVKSLSVDTKPFPSGQALVTWQTPKDSGGGKTLGFNVTYKAGGETKTMPRYLIPMAKLPGETVRMFIQDLPFKAGEQVELTIRAVDSVGNVGPAFSKTIRVSANPKTMALKASSLKPFSPSTSLPSVSGLKVAVIDVLDKADPVSGKLIPAQPEGYKGGNHIYSASQKRIRLQAGKNEAVMFQVNLQGKSSDISVKMSFPDTKLKTELFQFAYVKVKDGRALPDPLFPLTGSFSIPSTAGEVRVDGQTNHSVICEIYVPHGEAKGIKKGTVTITSGGKKLVLNVDLTVWNFTLPNKLSFIPEMNMFAWTRSPYNDKNLQTYRLAHKNRTTINCLPYGWSGNPCFSPKWNGSSFDWSEWDQKIGPLLDGSAFSDLPRKNEPVDCFYLPFNENWPMNIYSEFTPSYWADEAFTKKYRDGMKKAYALFAEHCKEKKWFNTCFEFYLNTKIYYRGKSKNVSAPWIFDEPFHTQDFWALRWFGINWHQAVDSVRGQAKMWYRTDVSYNQFQRNMLWGIADMECIGGLSDLKERLKRDEQVLWSKTHAMYYGCPNKIADSNIQPAVWVMSAWSRGMNRTLPWNSFTKSLTKAEQTGVFYLTSTGTKPSVRLKSFTVGQQMVEYMYIMKEAFKVPRYTVENCLKDNLALKGKTRKLFADDAGTIGFSVKGVDVWKTRCKIGEMLSKKAPPYKRALVEWDTPKTDMKKLPKIGHATVAPKIKSARPDCDNFKP